MPDYLREEAAYHGGVNAQYSFSGDDDTDPREAGWVARRWDGAVAARFHKLLEELGKTFDGSLAGVNLPETAVEFGATGRYYPPDFTPAVYAGAVRATMRAAAAAFHTTVVIRVVRKLQFPNNFH